LDSPKWPALRDLFLDATIGDVDPGLVRQPFAETGGQEALGHGGADAEDVALPEGARGVFDPMGDVALGMAGRVRAPLPEGGEVVGGIFPSDGQGGVEHRAHVAWIQEEAIAFLPERILRIVDQVLGVQEMCEVGAPHGAAWMTTVGVLRHSRRQPANVVSALPEKPLVLVHRNPK
jgi:hypothetical protein